MQKITQQIGQMRDSAASNEFLRSCQFSQASLPSGPNNHTLGVGQVDNSSVTQTYPVSSDNALQNRGMTASPGMCGMPGSSELECSLSQTRKPLQYPQQDGSHLGLSRQHPPTRNHRHQEQEQNPHGLLQRRLTGETAISPATGSRSQDSQASRLELLQRQHLEVPRHSRNEVERTEEHKLDHPSVLPLSLQRLALSNYNSVHDFPGPEKVRAALRSFDVASLIASTEALQAVERKNLTGKTSSSLHQEAMESGLTVKRKEQRKVTTRGGRKIVDRPRGDHKHTSQHLPRFLQQLQRRFQNEELQRQQVTRLKLHGQRPSHDVAGVVLTVGQDPKFSPAMASRIDSLKPTKKASRQRRRLHQKLEEHNGADSVYESRRLHYQQSSSAPSTTSQSLHKQLNNYTAIEVADAATFTAASSSAKRLNTTTGADATVLVAGDYPASATKQANVLQERPQAETYIFLPPPAPGERAAQPLPSESGYLLPAKLPRKQTVGSDAIPGTAIERADAFYFVAAAIGCSALLCVAGLILLLAIFRSYRLRQEKHEAAKQLIRKIHCSGELPTRELVVQYSRELRSVKHKHKDERHQKPARSFWKPFSSTYSNICMPTAPMVVLHSGHQHGEDTHNDTANIKAAVRTTKGAQNGEEEAEDKTSPHKGFSKDQCSGGAPAAEDRNAPSSQIIEAKSEVIKSRQTAEMPNTEGPADARLSVDVSLKGQQAHGEFQPHGASKVASAQKKDFSSHRLRAKDTPSSTTLKQVTPAAARKGDSSHVAVEACRHNFSLSSTDGALVASAGPRGTNPSGVAKDTLLGLHTHTYKHEVQLLHPPKHVQGRQEQQRQQLQVENGEQLQCSSKQRHWDLNQKVTCDTDEFGRIALVQRSRAAPGGSISLFHPALSISYPFPRSLFMTKEKQHKACASASQQGASSRCHAVKAGQETSCYNGKTCLSSCPALARVLYSPHENADGKCLLPGVSASARRLPYLLHPSSRTNSSSAKSGNSRRSRSSEFSATVGAELSDERNSGTFFSCGRRRTCRTFDCHYHHNPYKVFAAHRSHEEQLSSFLDGEQAVQTPSDVGERMTWVSEVLNGISCSLGTKSILHKERSYADQNAGAADNSSRGGVYPPSRTTASEWDDCSNTEIPTHMMTTAVNKEEEACSETATNSNEEGTENGDDAIVEFDTANVSLEIEVHSRQTNKTHSATGSHNAMTRTT